MTDTMQKMKSQKRLPRLCLASMFALCIVTGMIEAALADESLLWNKLRSGGHFGLLRHAIAPGTGDPTHFTLRDCKTQRNLSSDGRTQATKIGGRFHANGIDAARVYSSQWCRCLDTARLLSLGEVNELAALNSFYQREERRVPQTEALTQWLAKQTFDETLILVTHRVNISALTGVYPGSGELVIVQRLQDGNFEVAGTISTDTN